MKSFKDLGIKTVSQPFSGEKINIDRVLNQKITIHRAKIDPSKHRAGTDYLTLEIDFGGERRVIFNGGKALIEVIRQVRKEDFPFETTIIKNDRQYQFS